MNNTDLARLALENAVLLLDRSQPNVPTALAEVQKALTLLGGKFRK